MSWTKRQLDEAVIPYERALAEAGYTRGTINTYVGDAHRFVEWLAGSGTMPARPLPQRRRTVKLVEGNHVARMASPVPAPAALRRLVRDWQKAGQPPQVAMPWPRARWADTFPAHKGLFDALPIELDRATVRTVCATAPTGDAAAANALLATLAWGYGWVGYGPHRADGMLLVPDAARRLRTVATTIVRDGALAGYRSLGADQRIRGLGPAFGTKYLAFCQPEGMQPTALIHDELVTAWLEANGRPDLRASTWAPTIYERYLEQMHHRARELDISPETVEYLIFQAEADKRPRNQWARRGDASYPE